MYIALGVILVFREKLDDAIQLFNLAKEIDPINAVALYNLGVAYQVKDDTGQAEQFYRKALAVNPGFKEAQSNLTAMATIAREQHTTSSGGAATLSSGIYRHVADNAGTIHHSNWELTVSGNQITGTQVSKERADPLKGRIEGNQVTIERDCRGQGWQGECHQIYRGTIGDGIIEGSWSGTGARPSPRKVVWKLYLKPVESK